MTIPPNILWPKLIGCESILLKSATNETLGEITGTEARALALHGLVEGYCTQPEGRVRYVRHLHSNAQMPKPEIEKRPDAPERHKSRAGSILIRTGLGVYRERLNQVFCSDSTLERHDHRVVIGEGEQQGWCFTFCGQGGRRQGGTLGVSARKPDLEQLDARV